MKKEFEMGLPDSKSPHLSMVMDEWSNAMGSQLQSLRQSTSVPSGCHRGAKATDEKEKSPGA